MLIHRTGTKEWTNRHLTFTQPVRDLYDLANQNTDSPLNDYNATTKGIQGLLAEAMQTGTTIRALGGEWSWTKVAATDGVLLNTKPLNLSFRINRNNLCSAYPGVPDDLYFAQCGVSVRELNERLRVRSRSLKTTGASNGQTIVGAISTGTHGSAIDIGAMQDYIVGLHIICSPTRHLWLERASYPVVSDDFVQRLEATLVRNDDIFNAALVCFGSFGFIHGVMLETAPLFLYEAYRFGCPADERFYSLLETLDFSNAILPNGAERPYHFGAIVNPYQKENPAHITVMYKRPFVPDYTPPSQVNPALRPGDDGPAFIGRLTDAVPALVPPMVNNLVATTLKPYHQVRGTHAEFFTNTDIQGKVMSTAIGLPLAAVRKVTILLERLNQQEGPFAGVYAYRFVKGSKATLGFTQFDPTCILELDGVYSETTNRFYRSLWQVLRSENIPHTFHWGKIFQADGEQIRRMYPVEKRNAWLHARDYLLDEAACRAVFTNELLRHWQLDKAPGLA